MRKKADVLFAAFLLGLVLIPAGCSSSPPVINTRPDQSRADMVKWHQEHDKKPTT